MFARERLQRASVFSNTGGHINLDQTNLAYNHKVSISPFSQNTNYLSKTLGKQILWTSNASGFSQHPIES